MIKKIVLILIVLVCLVVAYSLIKQIIEATKSGERLAKATDEVYRLEKKNKELKQKISQVQSSEFLEAEIRNRLGLAKKGETIVIIPEDKLKLVLGATQSAQIRLPNWLGWIKVFFR